MTETIADKRRAIPPWALLTALVVLSTGLRFWAARRVPTPWITPDETIYGKLGQSLYRHGSLSILGGPTGFYSLLYPALAGAPLSLPDLDLGYRLLKALQALVMSLTAVPVFLWGRRLMRPGWALAAAVLTVSIPGLAYAGLVMSEVAFYPLLVLAAWACARTLARPTWRSQALLVLAIAAAVATRLQAVVLLPAFVTAIAVAILLDRRLGPLRRLLPALGGLTALAGGWVAWRLARGGSTGGLLGGYQAAAHGSYDVGGAASYVVYHLADLLLLSGVVPAFALTLLVVRSLGRREPSAEVRAYLATAVSFVAWIVVEVGIFASQNVHRLAERDLIGLAPLLFLALCLWLDRGAWRPRLLGSAVALALLLPVLALPVDRLVNEGALPDAFTLAPLYLHVGAASRAGVLFVAVAVALALAALVPRRVDWLLPALLVVVLAGVSVSASRVVAARASLVRTRLVGADARWVDERGSAPVAYLYDGADDWNGVWEQLFWNRRYDRVYDLPATRVPGPLPQRGVLREPDGRVVLASGGPAPARYVAASSFYTFVGTKVAELAQAGTQQPGLALWRLDQPFRFSTTLAGLQPNGDIYEQGELRVYGCGPGQLELTLLVKEPETIELRRNGKLFKKLRFAGTTTWSGTVPSPATRPAGGICTFDVIPSSLLGTTLFAFVRS